MESKKCILCKEKKPKTSDFFFYRNKEKGWLSSWCKECRSKKRKENPSNELEKQKLRREKKRLGDKCTSCKINDRGYRCTYCSTCLLESKRKKKKEDKAIYKSRLRKAMPFWANRDKIRQIYQDRPEGFHVDHIIPIRGDLVCGLHVHYNMQYLCAEDNMKKSNSFQDGNHYNLKYRGLR